jgi:hypothetical protein
LDANSAQTTSKFLGETWGFWIQTGALIISAIAAIVLIAATRRDNKRRATIDLVIQQKQDGELQSARRWVLNMHENQVTNFTKYLTDKESDEFKHILRVLNNYEFIAAGIREDALDEEIFKRVQWSVFMKDWDAMCGCIMELRRNTERSTLFQEFETLAKRWKEKPLKPYK